MEFARIAIDSAQMGGVPCVHSLRIPVAAVGGMLGDGKSETEILEAYPDLVAEGVREALRFAAIAVAGRKLPLVGARNS